MWATIAEAYLNQGQLHEAEKWYRQAATEARGRVGHLNSSRKQLRFLLAAVGEDPALVDEWLPIPNVAVFTGHRMDEAGRDQPRFPASLETNVKQAITEWLLKNNVRSCVCSAAQGSVILFLEALQAIKGSDTRIILPFPEADFVKASVKNGDNETWAPRFQKVLAAASRVMIASTELIGRDGFSFDYANRIIVAQGRLLAEELQASLFGLAVWDHQPSQAIGSTAHAIEHWQEQDFKSYAIDIRNASLQTTTIPTRQASSVEQVNPSASNKNNVKSSPRETPFMSMLFADAVGFSKLTDGEVELFVTHFLGKVAKIIAKIAPEQSIDPKVWSTTAIGVRETWGDGLYFAFKEIRTAGCFALDLCDAVRETKWVDEFGFSTNLQIRIAIHAGPVHLGVDPITGLPKCTGTHVSRAARLEPKTPANSVYASDAFASLAAAERVTEFKCDFVKLLDWAKHYGTYPTYVVRRGF